MRGRLGLSYTTGNAATMGSIGSTKTLQPGAPVIVAVVVVVVVVEALRLELTRKSP